MIEVKERGASVILTGGNMRRRGGGFQLVMMDTGGGYTSSPGKRFGVGERELMVGKMQWRMTKASMLFIGPEAARVGRTASGQRLGGASRH
jgi:hypothetical protein